MLGIDYVGLGALISATCAGVVSVVVALRQTETKQQVADVHAAVSMSNGGTLGGAIEQIDRSTVPPGVPPVSP